MIDTMIGDFDAAVDPIEQRLASGLGIASVENLPLFPSSFSVRMLRLDPRWRPLWDHPRFKALAAQAAS